MDETSLGNSTFSNQSGNCYYFQPPFIEIRFYLFVCVGNIISLISTVENSLLFITFNTKRNRQKSYGLYVIFLAIFDIFTSISYIFLMSVNVTMDYLNNLFMFRAWFSYVIPLISLTHCFMTTSSFLIFAASLEQFLITTKSKYEHTIKKYRLQLCTGSLIIGFITRGTMIFEYQIIYKPECIGNFSELSIRLSDLAKQPIYNKYWRFWFRNIFTVFFPFFALAYFNTRTVASLHKRHSTVERQNSRSTKVLSALVSRKHSFRRQESILLIIQKRRATRMFVWITVTYLVSNLLNVIITFWEHIDKENLLIEYYYFYIFSADTVSLFTVLSCALRLPIYCYCKPEIRKEISRTIRRKRKFNNDMEYPEAQPLMDAYASSPLFKTKQCQHENEEIEDVIWL